MTQPKNIGPYQASEAVLIGRFQPFTAGHLKAYKYAKQKYPMVSIALVVRKSGKRDKGNPFTPEIREYIIKKAIPGVRVYHVSRLEPEIVFGEIGHTVAIVVGKDRVQNLIRMGGSDKEGEGEFQYVEVPREDEDISATKVRNALREDDLATFKSLMPPQLYSEFERLKELVNAF